MLRYRRILVPFDCVMVLERTLEPALSLAQAMAGELVLLRIDPPRDERTKTVDGESLYSELKALWSKLQSRQIPVQIESIPGPANEAVLPYATQKNIDLIVLSDDNHLNFPAKKKESQSSSPHAVLIVN